MTESPQKLIPFAKIFEIAATHIFDNQSLLEFIPDEKSAVVSPENMRRNSQEAAIQLSLLRSEHAEIVKSLAFAFDAGTRNNFEMQRDALQAQIEDALQIWTPEPLLREYTERYEKAQHASFILEKLFFACTDGILALFLNSAIELPRDIFSRASGVRFLPKESILECEIDNEKRSGIVFGDEKEVKEWLVSEDIVAGVYDTREKRERKCAELYEARILDPKTCNCSKDQHFAAIREVIPGLLRKEFDAVRVRLASKYPQIKDAGRRPKIHLEI